MTAASEDASFLSAGPLRLQFARIGDRFQHRLCFQLGDAWQPLLESLESSSDEHWPHSPPLQHLHFEEHAGVKIAMLVGMAGASHWSAAISANGDELEFDIACRTSSDAKRLGSTYRLSPGVEIATTESSICLCTSQIRVELLPSDDTHIGTSNDQLIAAPIIEDSATANTRRWRYRIAVAK